MVALSLPLHRMSPGRSSCKGAAFRAGSLSQAFRVEGVEHELDAPGGTPQRRQHRIDPMCQERDQDEIERRLIVECDGTACSLALHIDDRAITLKLLQPCRAGRPRRRCARRWTPITGPTSTPRICISSGFSEPQMARAVDQLINDRELVLQRGLGLSR